MLTTFSLRDYYDWGNDTFYFPSLKVPSIKEQDLKDLHYCGRAKNFESIGDNYIVKTVWNENQSVDHNSCFLLDRGGHLSMKRRIIIVVLVLLCFVSIILGVYFIVHNNSSDKYTLESIRYEYLNSDRKVVAAVNDVDITNKELCLIQYSSHTNKPLEKAIEQKAIVQLAEADSFSLSESEENKEIEYITTQYEKLNLPDNEENNAFCDALIKEHLEMTTSVKVSVVIIKL